MRSPLQLLSYFSRLYHESRLTHPVKRLLPFVVLVWIASTLGAYRHVIGELLNQWQTQPNYSHGAIVLPIAIWLLWYRRSSLPRIGKPWMPGLGLLLVAHGLLWLGDYFHAPAVQRWTIPICLSGMIGLLGGRAILVWSLPGVCFLAFMIPPPFQLEVLANQVLQSASAWCSCWMLALTSTFAVTDGHSLRTATGRVGITADCSGLRMTVAIAALGYVITLIRHNSVQGKMCDRSGPSRLAIALVSTLLLAIPTAVSANALRITGMTLVMEHYQVPLFTSWAHDLGDWLVLPVSAALFCLFRTWLEYVSSLWSAHRNREADRQSLDQTVIRMDQLTVYLRIAMVPLVFAAVVGVALWNYGFQLKQVTAKLLEAAHAHEQQAEWMQAANCYRELVYVQPAPEEALYHLARVSRESAQNLNERKQAFFQLEAVLRRSPLHPAALRTQLLWALELDMGAEASRNAERLVTLDPHSACTLRLCLETGLRFPSDTSSLPAISSEVLTDALDKLGPVDEWRDGLLIALAGFCCQHPESANNRLVTAVAPAIAQATNRLGSAKARLTHWRFERQFGSGAASLETALKCIDDNCSRQVAYEIYLAAAEEAWLLNRPLDAQQFLKSAIEQLPTDHRSFALLGQIYAARRDWEACAAAQLRAWRLAGDHPLELGTRLAESLVRIGRNAESAQLVRQLHDQVRDAANPPDLDQRIRLYVVEAQLDMADANHAMACEKLIHCHALATCTDREGATTEEQLLTIESLQMRCWLRLGKYADVARLFESRARRMFPAAEQWTAAARAWRTAGSNTSALHCYRNALLKSETRTDVWLEYVQLLRAAQGVEAAASEIDLRRKDLTQGPTGENVILAQAWEIAGRPDLSIQLYQASAKRNAMHIPAYAIALARHGQVFRAVDLVADERWSASTEARAHTAAIVGVTAAKLLNTESTIINRIVEEGIATSVDNAPVLLAAAEWYAKRRDNVTAVSLLRRALILQPENVVAANNLAMLLADESCEYRQALQTIDAVLERTGPVSEILDTKGWILVQMNRAEEAIPWLTQAAERSPTVNVISQLHLATAYLALGKRDQALKSLELARAGRMRPETLGVSERRAWKNLQKVFPQQAENKA